MPRLMGRAVWRGQTWEDAPRSHGQQRAREKRQWRREAAVPDHARIAVLEYELLYVDPEPGSAAELAVCEAISAGVVEPHHRCGLCRRMFQPGEEWCPACTDCPEHGNDCSPWNRPIREYDCKNYRSGANT